MALILITGATGFIGFRLTTIALNQGHQVVTLGRRPLSIADTRLAHADWNCGSAVPGSAIQRIKNYSGHACLIHLAHEWRPAQSETEDENLAATKTLIDSIQSLPGLTLVLASSISARQDALNRYGRIKWRIEQLADNSMITAARIGLVYGGICRGLWGTLDRLASISPVIPMVEKRAPVQPIHVDDLCAALIHLAEKERFEQSAYILGAAKPISFERFLQSVAEFRHKGRLTVVNLPLWLALLGADFFSILPLKTEFNRERIFGLAGLQVADSADDLAALALSLRDLSVGLSESRMSNARRSLLREAVCLLIYIKGSPPTIGEIRRYVRGVCAFDEVIPLSLPTLLLRFPKLLRFIEPIPQQTSNSTPSLQSRLQIALIVCESSDWGAQRIFRYDRQGRFWPLFNLVTTGVAEVLLLPVRRLLSRQFRP